MKQLLILITLMSMVFMSCKDQEMIDENKRYRTRIKQLKEEIGQLQDAKKNQEFLVKNLIGVKARIVTDMGNIELNFYPEKAPLHCFTFINRAEGGFYDNTQFHRVIPGFMIQGGDPNTKTKNKQTYGSGGPLVMMPHEFNEISHKRGILSTARVEDPSQGAGCQFFIMHQDNPGLDNQYTVFGYVTAGMEVVDKIASTKRDNRNLPIEPVIIRTIEVYRD